MCQTLNNMKIKITLFTTFLLLSSIIFSQQYYREEIIFDSTYPKNEIRLNLLESVLGLPEIDYERMIQSNFGLGIASAISILNAEEAELRYFILSYARLYFGSTVPATGIFIESNAGLMMQAQQNDNLITNTITTKNYPGFGIGVAMGYKFLTSNSWVGEFTLGFGRVFGNRVIDVYPRVGISLGKRF